LQGDFKDFPQIADGLVPAEREYRDFLLGIIRRGEKGETLDVIPMKVSEPDDELILMVSDRAQVPTEIAKPRSGVKNGDTIRIRECDLKTGGVAAELLEASITDWDGAAGTVKFEFHTRLYGLVHSRGKLGHEKNFSWVMLMAAAFDSATCARENSWLSIPQSTEWQRIGD
jgi:hypothetical protein